MSRNERTRRAKIPSHDRILPDSTDTACAHPNGSDGPALGLAGDPGRDVSPGVAPGSNTGADSRRLV